MTDKLPQPTDVLWQRLHRAAKGLRKFDDEGLTLVQIRAIANTCDQAAGRLRGYFHEYGELLEVVEAHRD